MKKLSVLFFRFWRPGVLLLAIAILAYVLFFHNLAHLLPGYAPREVTAYNSANSLQSIADHPMGAPYKIFVYLAMKSGHHSYVITRVVAASLSVIFSLLFFFIARRWLSYRVAFLVTIMFATSSGFLHVARLGSQLILQMSILLLIAAGIWWQSTKKNTLFGYCFVLILGIAWYIPGMIWFELLIVLLSRQKILIGLRSISWLKRGIGIAIFLLLLMPLIRASILTPSTLLTFAGLPNHFSSPLTMLTNLRDSIFAVGIHSNGSPEIWLGHAPLLNVIELVLFGLGCVVLVRRHSRVRTYFVGGAIVVSLVLISFGGSVNISSLLPLLYLVIGIGIYDLLQRWLYVFPRNPFARFTGVFFICLIVLFSVLYQYRAYFVAWPNNISTRQTFSKQRQ